MSEPVVARGPWALAWRRLRQDRVAMISGGFVVFLAVVAIFAPLINSLLGNDPNYQDQVNGLDVSGLPVGPSGSHWFGTDELGRDVLARVIAGSRVSLGIGLASTALAVAVGVIIGLAAGFFGGLVDAVLARLIDVVLSIPYLLSAVAFVAMFGQKALITIFVIVYFSWASTARIVRGQVLSMREREYVEAARSLGAGSWRIMFVDLLPNLLMPILVSFSLLVPLAIVTESTLAFLGLGVPPPTADWGGMINEGQNGEVYKVAWWLVFFPAGLLLLTTLAFNLLGDGVRDAFDPRIERLLRK